MRSWTYRLNTTIDIGRFASRTTRDVVGGVAHRHPHWDLEDPRGRGSASCPTYANRTLHADVRFALRIRELIRADPVVSGPLVRGRIRTPLYAGLEARFAPDGS